jgi:hypothetical protein
MENSKKYEDLVRSRQGANRNIVYLLNQIIEKNPDLRFHQILQMVECNVMDRNVEMDQLPHQLDLFYEESKDTLARIRTNFHILKNTENEPNQPQTQTATRSGG